MAEQFNEDGGLRLKGDYTSPGSGYTGNTFNTPDDGTPHVSYEEPYKDNMFFEEPYDSTSSSHIITMDDNFAGVMTGAFMYMFMALLVTGITAVVVASSPTLLATIFGSTASLLLIFGLEFGIVWATTAAMKNNNVVLSGVLFFSYAIVNGLTLSVIFLVYTSSSIEQAFFSTAVVFGLMAVVGKVTNKDLSSIGSILMMGLIGVLITSLINFFIGSSALDIGISVVTIIIFMGLTAYDVQKIQNMADEHSGYNASVISLWGAMELYLDFINIFLKILRLMGKRK